MLVPEFIVISIEPACPAVALPVMKLRDPLAPELVVPLKKEREPETPFVPELLLCTIIDPLVLAEPEPPKMETAPPVRVDDTPDAANTLPPSSVDEIPSSIFNASLSHVGNITLTYVCIHYFS